MEKISNIKKERKVFKNRVTLASGFMLIMIFLLISRMYNLQITQHEHFTEEALGNQMQILPVTPVRGNILDRNGKVLATNKLSYRLTITPEKAENLNDIFIELQLLDLINDDDIEQFNNNMVRYKKFHSIPIKFSLTEEDVAIVLAGEQLPGVDIEPDRKSVV